MPTINYSRVAEFSQMPNNLELNSKQIINVHGLQFFNLSYFPLFCFNFFFLFRWKKMQINIFFQFMNFYLYLIKNFKVYILLRNICLYPPQLFLPRFYSGTVDCHHHDSTSISRFEFSIVIAFFFILLVEYYFV